MSVQEKCISDRILDATVETIAREKISGTRMHLIAQEAGTSQSNLHYYYPTKNDLILAVLDRLQQYFTKKRTASVSLEEQSFEENLHGFFEEKKDDILNHPKIDLVQFDYWVQGTSDGEIGDKFRSSFNIWRADIEKVLEQSGLSPEECAEKEKSVPYLMVSMMMGASMQYLIDEKKFDLDDYFRTAEEFIRWYYSKP